MSALKRHLLPVLSITVLSIVIYAGSLRNGFVYDDAFTIVKNTMIPDLKNLSFLVHPEYFALSGEGTYRPAVTLTNFIDYGLYGLNPTGWHLTNTLFHAANGIMLYFFLLMLAANSSRPTNSAIGFPIFPLVSSLLFVFHPALTEAVEAVSFREDLLAFFFFMSALNVYLYSRRKEGGGAFLLPFFSCVLYILALFSKEMAVTLPLVFFCMAFIYKKDRDPLLPGPAKVYAAGYLLVTALYVYIRFFYFYNPSAAVIPEWSLAERALTVPHLLMNYIKLMFLPISLSADYEMLPVRSLLSPYFIVPFAACLSLLAWAIFARERMREVSFGILFFFIALLPVLNVIPLINQFAERYLYLPSAGFAAAGGYFLHVLLLNKKRKIAVLGVVLMLAAQSALITLRHKVWRDNLSLWSDAAKKMPESDRAHYILGVEYGRKGLWAKAAEEYKIAVNHQPNHAPAHNNLGFIYYMQGMWSEAVKEYKAAIRYDAAYADAHYNLGVAYSARGMWNEAVQEYKAALRLNPGMVDVYINLGGVYSNLKLYDEAVNYLKKAVKLDPDFYLSHGNLATAYAALGKEADAVEEFEAALRLKPDDAETHYFFGIALTGFGRSNDGAEEFRRALTLDPGHFGARQALNNAPGNRK